jgi:hypothetical protein
MTQTTPTIKSQGLHRPHGSGCQGASADVQPASPIVNCQKQLAVETESQIESCHAHPSVGFSRSRPGDVVDGRDDRQRASRAAGSAGRATVRNLARAGRPPAGVAAQAHGHVRSGAAAQIRHRPVGRADARVQRGPGVPGDHGARDLRSAAPHDLRLLRQVRGDRRYPRPCLRRADCARRYLARGCVRGAAIDPGGGRQRRARSAGGALGR